MRKGRGLPWWLLARTLALGGAGIVASLYAIDRAHEKAAAKAREAEARAAELRSGRMVEAPELERPASTLAPADAPAPAKNHEKDPRR
jgi:hypothetical protein